MVDKKFIVAAIGVVVALGAVGPSLAQMFQQAEAHGVQAQLQSRFVRIDDETWSRTNNSSNGRSNREANSICKRSLPINSNSSWLRNYVPYKTLASDLKNHPLSFHFLSLQVSLTEFYSFH